MIYGTFFSATGTTKKIVTAIADGISKEYILEDFTLPISRSKKYIYKKNDIVILGVPVIAGRVPNLLLKFLNTLDGNGALGVPVVLFGNRNFDDALIELRDIMENRGFKTIAAAAFVGEHSFSKVLAKGRPNHEDLKIARFFGQDICIRLESKNLQVYDKPIKVTGVEFPYREYYMPRDRQGKHIDIRKVKPKTNSKCDDCKLCVKICPLGSIDFEDVSKIPGICMKCCACQKKCPKQAKFFDDVGYIYHKEELEAQYTRYTEPKLFI